MPAPVYIPVRDLVKILGLPDALRLVSHFGGGSLYLPHPSRLRPGNKIVEAIGLAAAVKLCAEWPQLDVMLPRMCAEIRRMQERAIRREEGLSVTQIAWTYLTTERNVYRVRARAGDDAEIAAAARAQLDLFSAAD